MLATVFLKWRVTILIYKIFTFKLRSDLHFKLWSNSKTTQNKFFEIAGALTRQSPVSAPLAQLCFCPWFPLIFSNRRWVCATHNSSKSAAFVV